MIVVVVTGGRDFEDADFIDRVLDGLFLGRTTTLIHGDARGVDKLCGAWAAKRNSACIACPADWNAHGKSAGFKRNQAMIEEYRPQIGVVFPGGRGTADMEQRMIKAALELYKPYYDPMAQMLRRFF